MSDIIYDYIKGDDLEVAHRIEVASMILVKPTAAIV